MARALALARRGAGMTSPNPMVGAVLVSGGKVIAEGWHARFGGPHAEPRLLDALRRAGKRVPSDAILYVTLEPCTYEGKTPACVDLLRGTPIRRLVVGATDPNPRVRGRGLRILREEGWQVATGILEEDARLLNLPFDLAHRRGRARVTLKIASSLDGKVADEGGSSRWITGPAARQVVGRLRLRADAIVVGRGTVFSDDPRLQPGGRAGRSPSRIVIDTRLAGDPDCRLARLFRSERGRGLEQAQAVAGNWSLVRSGGRSRWIRRPRLIVACSNPSPRRAALFRRKGWEVWNLPARGGGVDLPSLARHAALEGLLDLLVEPGPRLAAGFLSEGPVDRIFLFLAPRIVGGPNGWGSRIAGLPLRRAVRTPLVELSTACGPDLALLLQHRSGRPLVSPRDDPRRML